MTKKKDLLAEKEFTDYQLDSGATVDRVTAKIFELELDNGPYQGISKKYGVEIEFYDSMFNGGLYEYHRTLGVEKVNPSRWKAFYLEKIAGEKVFDSIEDLVIQEMTEADVEATERLTEPVHQNPDQYTKEERAEAALDSMEDISSGEIDRDLETE